MLEFFHSHHAALVWLAWTVVSAIVTVAFKPRTPEQYSAIAKDWPRVAATLQLVGALGIDVPKILEAVGKMISGQDKPPPGSMPPPGTLPDLSTKTDPPVAFDAQPPTPRLRTFAVVTIAAIVMAMAPASCTPDARQALLETGLDVAKCAVENQDMPDAQIIKVCAIQAIDVERILRIVGEARKASAAAAAKAAERASAAKCEPASNRFDAGAR